MKLLVVGGGGREHALGWAIRRELPAAALFFAPGNAGTASLGTNLPIAAEAIADLVGFADRERIDLVIVGPEGPLALGLADAFRLKGRPVFGPNQAAAEIEASKAWSKDVMAAARIPTASSRTFEDFTALEAYVAAHPEPLVVKASGLAAGKGAVVCATRREALDAARAMLVAGDFGAAGRVVVVESFLVGEELSVLVIANGTGDFRFLPAAQDHKRLLERDAGPNTGGMGAYSPVALETPDLLDKVAARVIRPALAEMARRNATFSGVLYAGLMVDASGDPHVIEFNCRFGDPETQVILPRIESGVVGSLWAAATGEPLPALELAPDAAVTTVLAAAGYPDRPLKGAVITIPDALPPGAIAFHAGTARDSSGRLVVSGGRVLAVTGVGPTFEAAQRASRDAAQAISFEGKQFRRDIGWREAARRPARAGSPT